MTPDDAAAGPDADQRAAYRRFVREHHPDRGGDPEVFANGIRAFREGRTPGLVPDATIHIHRSPRGVGHVTHWVRRRWTEHTRPPRVR